MAVSLLNGTGDDAGDEASEHSGPAAPVGPVHPRTTSEVAQMRSTLAQMNASLRLLMGAREHEHEAAFLAKVDELIAQGAAASARDALLEVGRSNRWDLSKLDGLAPSVLQLGGRFRKPLAKSAQALSEREADFRAAGFAPTAAKRMAEAVTA